MKKRTVEENLAGLDKLQEERIFYEERLFSYSKNIASKYKETFFGQIFGWDKERLEAIISTEDSIDSIIDRIDDKITNIYTHDCSDEVCMKVIEIYTL